MFWPYLVSPDYISLTLPATLRAGSSCLTDQKTGLGTRLDGPAAAEREPLTGCDTATACQTLGPSHVSMSLTLAVTLRAGSCLTDEESGAGTLTLML